MITRVCLLSIISDLVISRSSNKKRRYISDVFCYWLKPILRVLATLTGKFYYKVTTPNYFKRRGLNFRMQAVERYNFLRAKAAGDGLQGAILWHLDIKCKAGTALLDCVNGIGKSITQSWRMHIARFLSDDCPLLFVMYNYPSNIQWLVWCYIDSRYNTHFLPVTISEVMSFSNNIQIKIRADYRHMLPGNLAWGRRLNARCTCQNQPS